MSYNTTVNAQVLFEILYILKFIMMHL